jgi:hypothetical protein
MEPIESDTKKAQRLLAEMFPDPKDIKKLKKSDRSQERIGLVRKTIEQLIHYKIPTAVIAEVLDMAQPVIQYHLRWLEKNGSIRRKSKTEHWIRSERPDSNLNP